MTRQYTLLGKLAIADNGRSSAIMNYKKGCALLAYLIVTRQTHSREVVADLLWEATSTAKAFHSLRTLLYKLRPLASELVVNAKQVSFQAAGEITVDLYTLAAALSSPDSAELDAALALYKGDLLDGFFLDNAPRFGEWLLLAREQLRQRVWAGYRRLCAAYAAAHEWPKGIAAAHRWLQLDNLDEEIQRQLMQFLAANGQVEAALAQYERCCQLLEQELGVEPEAATTAAAAQLQQLLLPAADQLAEPGPLPACSYLPYHRNRVFTGRAAYLKQLAEVLLPETVLPKTAVISGMGGLGKTQLAVEYAYRYGRYYSGGVYWISFAEEENVSEVIAGIGGSRGMKLYQPADKLTLAEQVARVQAAWQESVPRLLIFDNCENELPAAAWLPVSGGCSVLITSRRGHWSPEMPLQEIPLSTLSITESVTFLQQLAGHLSSLAAKTIAKEVGSLPLALQLAGHYLARQKQVSPQDYLVQLREEPLL
ncbi:MAG: hypothetical protein KC419_24965, partial [Anaerolineales bacterium]|nr:hypothetical protein [Anaerolineales bacterium]